MQKTLIHQYQFVIGARGALLDYFDTIKVDDLLRPLSTFNNESMLSQLTHVANCYLFWLAHYAMQEKRPFFTNENNRELNSLRQTFQQVDMLVNEFLHQYGTVLEIPVTLPRKGDMLTTTPLQVFTHVTTHEFHHKGQVLSMSRQLGYIPVDTDVIRT